MSALWGTKVICGFPKASSPSPATPAPLWVLLGPRCPAGKGDSGQRCPRPDSTTVVCSHHLCKAE